MQKMTLAACLTFLGLCPAFADNVSTVHYPVKGKSAPEIQSYIKQNGPVVGRSVPYAFTMIATKVDKKTAESKGECRYRTHKTSMVFTYVLPKLSSSAGLPKATLANWNAFTAKLREHETLHKDNWRSCMDSFDKEATEITAGTCERLEKKAAKRLEKRKLDCLRNDMKIDSAFGRELWKDPFVKEAMAGSNGKGRNVFGFLGSKKKQKDKN